MSKPKQRLHRFAVGLIAALVVLCVGLVQYSTSNTATAAAGINHKINFQGKLVNPNGTNVTDGSYSVVFSIYSVSSGGTAIWTETQSVTLSNGIFQVNLGSVTPLPGSVDFNTDNTYLGIKVGADAEMTPRIEFTSVPEAFNSEKLGGLSSSAFAQLAANQTFTGTNTFQPTSNATGLKVLQNSSGAFGQDVFLVQGSAGGSNNFIQVTSTAANQGAVTIASLGNNNLSLNSGSNVISVGATNLAGTGALSVDAGTTNTLSLGTSANNKTINIGATGSTNNTTTVNIANSSAGVQAVNIGNGVGASAVTITSGTGNINLNGTVVANGQVQGVTFNGTTGINTGAGNGTQRIDASGNLKNINDITTTNSYTTNLVRTVPTTVGNEVDLGSFALTNGGGSFEASITVPSSGFSSAKNYSFGIKYDQTTNTWVTVQPISDSSPYGGQDFNLEANVNLATLSLRLRRTAGATAGTAYIVLKHDGIASDAFTPSTTTTAVAAPTTYLGSAIFTQSAGAASIQGSLNTASTITVGTNTSLSTTTLTIGGNPVCTATGCTAGAGSGSYIQNTTSQQANSNFNISNAGVIGTTLTVGSNTSLSTPGIKSIGYSSNGTDGGGGLELGDGSGVYLRLFRKTDNNFKLTTGSTGGQLTIAPNDSTGAFQIQNTAGTSNLFDADTANSRIGIGTLSPSYKLDVQGGDINTSGAIRTGGTQRLDAAGNLSSIGTIGSGAITSTSTIQGTQFVSTVATGTAPLTVASTTQVANLNASLLGGLSADALSTNARAQANISGGGTVSWSSNNLTWSSRFIVISNGTSYYQADMPANGTVITGVGGQSNVTVTASGIPFSNWMALYYVPSAGTYRVASYTSGSVGASSEWILIAVHNADNGSLKLGTGLTLLSGQTSTNGVINNAQFATSVNTGTVTASSTLQGTQLISTVSTGTAPLTVNSSTKVVNLNADLLDGLDSTAFALATGSTAYIQNGTSQQASSNFNVSGNGTVGGNFIVNGGANPSSGTGLLLPYAASTPGTGPAVRWSDGSYGNTFGFYVQNGLNFQGNASNPSFFVRNPTSDGTLGGTVIKLGGANGTDTSYFNAGNFGIGTSGPNYKLDVQGGDINTSGAIRTGGTQRLDASGNLSSIGTISSGVITSTSTIQGTAFTSTVSTGTAPLTVSSSTKVTNLNADLLDGLDSTAFALTTDSTNFIRNQTGVQASSNFNISGTGTIGTNLVLGSASVASFGSGTGDKLQLFSNTYGIGIEPSNLTSWSNSQFRFRVGGTSVSTGTEVATINATTANFIGVVSGANLTATASSGVGLSVQGAASTDIAQFKNSAGTIVSRFDASGILIGKNAATANTAGSALVLAGGQGNGTGAGGDIVFKYAPSTGATPNVLQNACTISGTNGSLSCPGANGLGQRFGLDSSVNADYSLVVGAAASVNGSYSLAVGNNSSVAGVGSIALGAYASATSDDSVAVGQSSLANGSTDTAFGKNARTIGNNGLAAGAYSLVQGDDSVALGTAADAIGTDSVSIGRTTNVSSNTSIGIGSHANVFNNNSIALGAYAATTASNQLVIGSSVSPITSVAIGNGVTNGAPGGFTLQATSGLGTNVAGATATIAAGQGTGTAAGGNITFQIAQPASTSSATSNSLNTVATISGTNGSAVFKNAVNGNAAFQVQNAAGTKLFTVDTTNNSVAITGNSGSALQVQNASGINTLTANTSNQSILVANSGSDFNLVTTASTGTNPRSIATGDINGDGRPDTVVTNFGTTTASVYINNAGALPAVPSYSINTGTSPFGVALVDINGDGRQDAVIANSGATSLSVYLNTNGVLPATASASLANSVAPRDLATGDFNSDGRPDIAVVNFGSNTATIYLNSGTALASSPSYTLNTGTNPVSATVADFNGDGRPDLAIANYGANTTSVYLNSAGTLPTTPSATLNTGSVPIDIASADINADGRPDLFVANNSANTTSVYLNSAGTLPTTPSYALTSSGSGVYALVAADINADGRPDISVVNGTSKTVDAYLNNGAAVPTTASYTLNTATDPAELAAADINADGTSDLLIVNYTSNTLMTFTGKTIKNAFSPVTITNSAGSGARSVASADFNGDGKTDIITIIYASNTAYVYLGGINGIPATPSYSMTTGTQPISPVTGDINGDGRPDAIVNNSGSNSASVYINSGGTLPSTPSYTLTTGSVPYFGGLVDINNDGRLDYVVGNGSANTASVYINSGGALPTTASYTINTGAQPFNVASADFNGDGRQDVAIANVGANTVSVYLNASGTLPTTASYTIYNVGTAVAVTTADINGDNRPDLVVASSSGPVSGVFINNNGTLPTAPTYTVTNGASANALTSGDINGDGRPDLAFSNTANNTVAVFLNTGTSYASTPTYSANTLGTNPQGVTIADINGDGRRDIVVSNNDTGTLASIKNQEQQISGSKLVVASDTSNVGIDLRVGLGNTQNAFTVTDANGTLLSSITSNGSIMAGSGGIDSYGFNNPVKLATQVNPGGSVSNDFNADGKPDLVVTNTSSNSASVYYNSGSALPTTASATLTTGSAPGPIASADINNDGRPDLVVGNTSADTVSIYNNNGSNPWFNTTASSTISSGIVALSGVTLGDINGDGKVDMVVTNQSGTTASVYLNTGTALSTTASYTVTTGSSVLPTSPVLADVNSDGRLDLIVTNTSAGTASVFLNSGGTLSSSVSSTMTGAGTNPIFSTVTDINGDGRPDFVVTGNNSNSVKYYLNSSGALSGAASGTLTSQTPKDVKAADFNGDGRPDLAVAVNGGYLDVYLNNNGSYPSLPSYNVPTGSFPQNITITDFNGDGRPDVTATLQGVTTSGVAVLYSMGTARLKVTSAGSTNVGQIVQGVASQTADLLQAQDVNGNVVASIDAYGDFVTGGSGSNGRIILKPANGSTLANRWNIDNNGGQLRIFRDDFDGTNGSVKLSISETGFTFTGGRTTVLANGSAQGINGCASTDFYQITIDGTCYSRINNNGETVINTNVSGSSAVCFNTGTNNVAGLHTLSDCSGSVNADYAELYPVTSDVTAGDIVMPEGSYVTSNDGKNYQVPRLKKTTAAYDSGTIGVVSDQANDTDFTTAGHNISESENPKPIALNGRVLTKVSTENGPIKPGDYVTASSVPGVGMKATHAGEVIGRALQAYDGQGVGQVLVFVNPSYYNPDGLATNTMLVDLTVTGSVSIQHTLTVEAIVVGNITINGHIATGGEKPLTQALVAAGTGASVVLDGNDTAGTITITTGAGGLAAGDLSKISFKKPFGKTPRVILSGQDDASINARIFPSGKTANDYTLKTSQTLLPNTTYTFDYFIVE